MHWYTDPIQNHYVDFEGRASRRQFWMFTLINFVISFAFGLLERVVFDGFLFDDLGVLSAIYSLAVLLPSLGISVRRLHDIDISGWALLIALIPIIGWIILVVWYARAGDPGANKYGPRPLEPTSEPSYT